MADEYHHLELFRVYDDDTFGWGPEPSVVGDALVRQQHLRDWGLDMAKKFWDSLPINTKNSWLLIIQHWPPEKRDYFNYMIFGVKDDG
jgi:hypothetical protein